MYSVTRWKKLRQHERNELLRKLKLPYEVVDNRCFRGRGASATPCEVDEVVKAVNAALPPEEPGQPA